MAKRQTANEQAAGNRINPLTSPEIKRWRKQTLARMLVIGLPIAGQVFLESSLNFIDNFMIGRLGEANIAGVALGNQVFFVLLVVLFGIGSGVSVLAAQYWGKRNIAGIRSVQGIALIAAGGLGLAVATISVSAPSAIIRLFTPDAAVVAVGAEYLGIMALSFPATAVTMVFSQITRACGETRVPLRATVVGFSVNVVINATLIFGLVGFPAMGAAGAAIGTLVARVVEASLLLGAVYRRKLPAAARMRELLHRPPGLRSLTIRTSGPVVLNEVGWSLGVTVYTAVFARISTEALAARNIADIMLRMLLVAFIGLANAAAIMIGNTIGEGKHQEARQMAGLFSLLSPGLAVLTSGLLLLLAPVLPRLFAIGPDTSRLVTEFCVVIALTFPFKALTLVQIVGIFRGGGDTVFAMLADVVGVWGVGVPLTAVGGLVLGLPPWLVFFLSGSEEILKGAVSVVRTARGRWLHDLTQANLGIHAPEGPKAVLADASATIRGGTENG